jgi:hypothetical protein
LAYPVALQEIRNRVLQRVALEGSVSFITPAELTDMINVSIADWYDLVRLTTFAGQYYRKKATLTVGTGLGVGGSSTLYPLPFNFLSMVSLDIATTGSIKPWSGRPYQEEDRNSLNYPAITTGWFGPLVWYQLQDANINFLSVPNATYTCTLNFVPTAPKLAQPEDTLESHNSWDEFIVLKTCMKALFKDGRYDAIAILRGELEEQRDRIRTSASERDQTQAEVVHDLLGNTSMGYGFTGQGEGWP